MKTILLGFVDRLALLAIVLIILCVGMISPKLCKHVLLNINNKLEEFIK